MSEEQTNGLSQLRKLQGSTSSKKGTSQDIEHGQIRKYCWCLPGN